MPACRNGLTVYDGWIIHGDKHNNDLEKYPFISQKDRTANACAEVVNYTPPDLDELVRMVEAGRSYGTIDGQGEVPSRPPRRARKTAFQTAAGRPGPQDGS